MKKIFLAATLIFSCAFLRAQNITLTPNYAELDGDPSVILEIHIDLQNTGEHQAMTWLRTMNEIPDGWTSSVCDFNLCWSPLADEPGYPFDLKADTTGSVYVKFDARNYHDGAFDPIPGCGDVGVTFYSTTDSANYTADAVFHARLGVEETDCSVAVISPVLENSFAVYPNPAVNTINVMASFSAHISRVEIVNIVGRTVQSETWTSGAGKMGFDITALPQGIYFVRLINDKGTAVYTEKISVTE